MGKRLDIYIYQHKGKKSKMEDRVLVGGELYTEGYNMVSVETPCIIGIADGVGGIEGGAYAADTVLKTLSLIKVPTRSDEIEQAIRSVHFKLIKVGRAATTLSLLYLDINQAYLLHIGNSRIYVQFGAYLRKLTDDHTLYEQLLYSGIDKKSISESDKYRLTACIGGRNEAIDGLQRMDITSEYKRTKKIIMTSDGIHDYLSFEDLEGALLHETNEIVLKQSANQAIQKGSSDDISIVVIKKE